MNKLRGLDQFKSVSGSGSSSVKSFAMAEAASSGSFANLKLTAEKLVKEQASVKTDLDIASSKLKKSLERIRLLEEKLQIAFNENAKLKVKLKEDEKLWEGLESKLSSTKTFCDQLMDTLQQLAAQVQDAEKDKLVLEGKLAANLSTIGDLNIQMNSLTLKLDNAEKTINHRDMELKELQTQGDEREQIYKDEKRKLCSLVDEKDCTIKELDAKVQADKGALESLNSKMAEAHFQLRKKEDELTNLSLSLESREKEKRDIQSSNEQLSNKLLKSQEETKELKILVQLSVEKLVELDEQGSTLSKKLLELNSMYCKCFQLTQAEHELVSKRAEQNYDKVRADFLRAISEKDASLLVNQQLQEKVIEFQRAQESLMVQHAEELRVAEDKIRILDSEAAKIKLEKMEIQSLISKLEENISNLSNSAVKSEKKLQELTQSMSAMELESKDRARKFQLEIQRKAETIGKLQKEVGQSEQQIEQMKHQISQLQSLIEEKEHNILQHKIEEKEKDDLTQQLKESLSSAENRLAEATKQYDVMLESRQLELSRHLKEISQKNDQAINDIRRKYEVEKLKILDQEKEKVEKVIGEMERKCEENIAAFKEETEQNIARIQAEHSALVSQMKEEYEKQGSCLKASHMEELKQVQVQGNNELMEKIMSLRREHEAEVRALRTGHEDECKKLRDELDLQKTKEDRQRALLQLQWKIMGNNQHEDQEVDSKKDYSRTAMMRNPGSAGKSLHTNLRAESNLKRGTQTPVSKLIKNVDVVSGSVISMPKNSRKVTRHEYEVETTDGKTVTKRRKTKSTVMFEDLRKHQKIRTPRIKTPKNFKGMKGGNQTQPSNIGDLFSEGSLNPYADDPYAFG